MPVMGRYKITWVHDRNQDVFLSIEINVGDGEHPPVDRGAEKLTELGIDMTQWSCWYAKEVDLLIEP